MQMDNKLIVKNTLFLYLRMIVVMGIGLYTVRAILDLLGVVDYGIYNVVGGVVGMFSFVNSTLATSSQRYFSFELAKGNRKRVNDWFCLNITTFSIFIIGFVVIAETIGLWFVNTQMTIPKERLMAANVVYQLSILSFCISFFSVPYNALIIAHERMSAFAYISIVEAVLKLIIVFILIEVTRDRLIIYGILMLLTSCGITMSYIIYNRRHFEESKYHFYWNKKESLELLGFSGWHFLGTSSMVVRSQGINILINMFFNPSVNAARAVAFQVYTAAQQLSNNFFTAVKPQIYKDYAKGDNEALYSLIIRSTIMTVFLISILALPLISNTEYILGLWLKEIPEYTVIFTQLVLINGIVDSTNGPTIAAALATGKIKNYQIIISIIIFMNLPLSYIALKLGADASITMIISTILSFIAVVERAFLLRSMIGLSFKRYMFMLLKLIIATLIIIGSIKLFFLEKATTFWSLVLLSILIVLITCVVYLLMVFEKKDVKLIIKIIKKGK